MGVHTLHDKRSRQAAMFCSTTDFAFGPVFCDSDDHDADERLDAFLRWLAIDPRLLDDSDLQSRYATWLSQEAAQFAAEKAAEEARWNDLDA